MKRVMDDSIFLFFGFFLFCLNLHGQVISGPVDYQTAGNNLAEFFILSSNHQPVRSSEDFNKFWGTYTESGNWNEDYSSEFSISVLQMPINQTMKYSLQTFDVAPSSIPQNIYIPRFQYMVGISRHFAIGASALYSYDIGEYGLGLNAEYTAFQVGAFSTGFLLNYGGSWKNDFMSLSSGKFSVVETWKLDKINLYAGIGYIKGSAEFNPPPAQQAFGRIDYESTPGENYFIGFSWLLAKNLSYDEESLVFTTQVDFEKNLDPSVTAKLTLRLPSSRVYSKSIPMRSNAH